MIKSKKTNQRYELKIKATEDPSQPAQKQYKFLIDNKSFYDMDKFSSFVLEPEEEEDSDMIDSKQSDRLLIELNLMDN